MIIDDYAIDKLYRDLNQYYKLFNNHEWGNKTSKVDLVFITSMINIINSLREKARNIAHPIGLEIEQAVMEEKKLPEERERLLDVLPSQQTENQQKEKQTIKKTNTVTHAFIRCPVCHRKVSYTQPEQILQRHKTRKTKEWCSAGNKKLSDLK